MDYKTAKIVTKQLSDSGILHEAIGPDGYPCVKGSKECAYYNSPEARQKQIKADEKRDALIVELIAGGEAWKLGQLIIDQATEYALKMEEMQS